MFMYLSVLEAMNCPSLGHKVLSEKLFIMNIMINFYLWTQSKGHVVSWERWIWPFFCLAWLLHPPQTSRIQFINLAVIFGCCNAGPAQPKHLCLAHRKIHFYPVSTWFLFNVLNFGLLSLCCHNDCSLESKALHLVPSRCWKTHAAFLVYCVYGALWNKNCLRMPPRMILFMKYIYQEPGNVFS